MNEPNRVRVEAVDWATFAPVTRMAGSFRQALHPAKLGLGLLLAVLLYLLGYWLQIFFGSEHAWTSWDRLTTFVGWYGLLASLLSSWFWLSFLLLGLVITAYLGGAICRFSAFQACQGRAGTLRDSLRFAGQRYVALLVSPLLALMVVAVIGLVLALAGLALFNLPVLDMLGGLLFGVMLIGGLAMAVLLIGTVVASMLMGPAMAIEGTDAFDVVSRTFNYAVGRGWRFLSYELVALAYGLLASTLVGFVLLLCLELTRACVGWWIFGDVAAGAGDSGDVNWFTLVTLSAYPGDLGLAGNNGFQQLGWSSQITAWMLRFWIQLLMLLLPAFVISFFFTTQTWVYLLLRRSADGTEIEHLHVEPDQSEPIDQSTESGSSSSESSQ